MRNHLTSLSLRAVLCTVGLVVSLPESSQAAIMGASAGQSLRADVHLLAGSLGIQVGPIASATGAAPSAYSHSHTVASVSASALGVASLNTGLLDANADSNINNGSLSGFASADATVNQLALRIVPGTIIIPDLISLNATTISSNVQVGHDGSAFTSTGGIVIENAVLRVSGVGLIAVNANAAPNTVLLDLLGIRIVLNEQFTHNDGVTLTRTVNALRITVSGPLQAVNADVVIASSSASVTVPSAPTAGLFGTALLAGARRRRPA